MPSDINSGKPIVPEASFVCRPPYTCRAPARHLSAARPTFVRRAPLYDFAVSYHETRSEQSLRLLRAFIDFEPTFWIAWTKQSMHHNRVSSLIHVICSAKDSTGGLRGNRLFPFVLSGHIPEVLRLQTEWSWVNAGDIITHNYLNLWEKVIISFELPKKIICT